MNIEGASHEGKRRPFPKSEELSRESEPDTPSPAEGIRALRKLPHAERQEALFEYKDFLDNQRAALAALYNDITEMLIEDPETPYGELEKEVEHCLEKAYIDEDRAHGVYQALEAFDRRRQAIIEYRTKFPDDADLYRELFGKPPRRRVTVFATPSTLYFQCRDLEDYARIFLSGSPDAESSLADANRLGTVSKSGGVSISYAADPRLEGALAAERLDIAPGRENLAELIAEVEEARGTRSLSHHSRSVMHHEEQHAIHRMLMNPMLGPESLGRERRGEVPLRSRMLAEAREARTEYADNQARTEILAYYSQGYGREDVERVLFDKEGLYNYLTPEVCKAIERKLSHFDDREAAREEVQSAVAEYPAVIHEALNGLAQLHGLYDSREITAHLVNEPLSRWPKVARRLVEHRLLERSRVLQ